MSNRIAYSTVVQLAIILLSAIIFARFNGMVSMIFGITAPFSPIILLLSIVIVFVAIFKEGIYFKGKLFLVMIAFYLSYIFIGSIVYLYDSDWVDPGTSLFMLYRSYFSSIVVISAFYFGANTLIVRNKTSWLLVGLFCFTLFSTSFSAISPFIGLTSILEYGGTAALDDNRNSGLFGNPNIASAFGLYFIVICLTCYSYFKRGNILFLCAIPIGIYVIFSSFSRASMIFMPFIIILYVLYNLRHSRKLNPGNSGKVFLFSILITAGTIFTISNFFKYVEDLSYGQRTRLLQTFQLLEGQVNKKTTSHRSDIFEYAFELIVKRPLTGYGLGSFHKLRYLPGSNKMGAHNTHLLIIGESGIIPFIFFLLFIGILLTRGIVHIDPAIGFFVFGVGIIFFFNVAGAGHNALDERSSNALLGIAMAFSIKKKYIR